MRNFCNDIQPSTRKKVSRGREFKVKNKGNIQITELA